MNVTRYLSLSYSTQKPFMMDTKNEKRRKKSCLLLYYYYYYYYYLLLFPHSFIALDQLTTAPSSSSSPHPVSLHYFSFAGSTLFPYSFQRGGEGVPVASVISEILPLPSLYVFISPFLIPQHVLPFHSDALFYIVLLSFILFLVVALHACSNMETDTLPLQLARHLSV
jgi:hypothetical protein